MAERECKTQAEVDAAIVAGHTIIVRDGSFTVSGSARVYAYDWARVSAYDTARVDAYGSARVDAYDSARVIAYGSASVIAYDTASVDAHGSASVDAHGSARVYDGASGRELRKSLPVVLLGPIGSRRATLAVRFPIDGEPICETGCFSGTPDELRAAVATTHPSGQYAAEYAAALALIDAMRGQS